jgi:ATP-binding cassette subfamily B (MDR/TAP) protein 1
VATKMVPYKELYRYATVSDKILIVIGALASAANGVVMPLFSVIFGSMTDAFSGNDADKMVSSAGTCAM